MTEQEKSNNKNANNTNGNASQTNPQTNPQINPMKAVITASHPTKHEVFSDQSQKN